MDHPPIRYLMTAIVQEQDVDVAERALALLEVPVIHLASTGGFLGRRNATLLSDCLKGWKKKRWLPCENPAVSGWNIWPYRWKALPCRCQPRYRSP
jgi:hypothetical protein